MLLLNAFWLSTRIFQENNVFEIFAELDWSVVVGQPATISPFPRERHRGSDRDNGKREAADWLVRLFRNTLLSCGTAAVQAATTASRRRYYVQKGESPSVFERGDVGGAVLLQEEEGEQPEFCSREGMGKGQKSYPNNVFLL